MTNNNLSVISLISIGEHPTSRRPRRAEQDARAVELGLKLAGERLKALYAGTIESPSIEVALRSYLGMGLAEINILNLSDPADATLALAEHLKAERPDMILTGVRAENGESSGMMPYLLAEQLGMSVITSIVEVSSIDKVTQQAEVLQALPRGQRRKLKIKLPFIASVDMAADAPRQSAYGPAMRGKLVMNQLSVQVEDTLRSKWQINEGQKRPKRLKIVKAKTAADRFKAATAKVEGGSGKIVHGSSESAKEILKMLIDEGVL
ncbi:MAG: electron transfer flavoprotein subunit beta [Alteromonadaceae bacterium]|nr:electron transfer flavoprotein subunit beta [Alteromonadaceae bacterium]